jgi:hypothetical protein
MVANIHTQTKIVKDDHRHSNKGIQYMHILNGDVNNLGCCVCKYVCVCIHTRAHHTVIVQHTFKHMYTHTYTLSACTHVDDDGHPNSSIIQHQQRVSDLQDRDQEQTAAWSRPTMALCISR